MPETNKRSRFTLLAFAAVVLIAAHLLDPFAFRYWRMDNVYGEDWGKMLRVMGFLPLWIAAGTALILQDRTPRQRLHRSRGGLLVLSAGLGGLAAEIAKIIIRRRRPGELGEYTFRSFADRPFSSGGLGMPSSHALVAFGAAAILSRFFPRASMIWWGLAWGCGLTRVADGAHFFSDVVLAAIIGWAVGLVVWRWHDPATTPG